MTLTAQDVHERQFRMVRQTTGYDIDEVDAFLDEVEAELRRLQGVLEQARAAGFVESDETLGGESGPSAAALVHEAGLPAYQGAPAGGDALAEAEQPVSAAARILELAQRTADEYLSEAQHRVDRLRAEAVGVERRMTELRSYETDLRGRLRGYFTAEIEQLRAVLGEGDHPADDSAEGQPRRISRPAAPDQ